jgi:glycosyltransferase involved in cell wall biosynthesis
LARVSVIVPCYKQAHFLGEALDSLGAQTHRDWECIIVNDGSPDQTREVALGYCTNDNRFRYVEQENRGLAGARNRGLDEVRGDYVQFLDADDAIAPPKFERQLALLSSVDAYAVSYCDFYYADSKDLRRPVEWNYPMPRFELENRLWDIASRWESELVIPIHCFLFDARFFKERGIRFQEKLITHEDWDCWMRIFAFQPAVFHVPDKLAVYRFHPASMTGDTRRMWKGFNDAIEDQLAIWKEDPTMRNLLRRKRQSVRARYGRSLSYNVLKQLSGSQAFRRHMPWPVQKSLGQLLDRWVR